MSDEKEAAVRRAAEALAFGDAEPDAHDLECARRALDRAGVWERIKELEREVAALDAILMDQSRGAAARAHDNERLRDRLRFRYGDDASFLVPPSGETAE